MVEREVNVLLKNQSLLGDKEIPTTGDFESHKWVKTINNLPGITALAIAGCIVFIFIIILITQIFRKKHIRKYFIKYFNLEKPDNPSKKNWIIYAAKFIIFIILAAGLAFVTYYNINKMRSESPLVTLKLLPNLWSPSILICPSFGTPSTEINLVGTQYSENVNSEVT